ncbi:MAG: hypothetical protein RLZZ598_1702 [Pseudomonadota bacterium]|jgi:hypothetical protein
MMQHSIAMERSAESAATSTRPPGPASATPGPALADPGRRRLLKLGAGTAAAVTLAGLAGAWLWSPGWRNGHLNADGRAIFGATALAVLEGLLPTEPVALKVALDAHLGRVEATLAALPRQTQAELTQLLGLLQLAPVRRWLTGLELPWQKADLPAAHAAIKYLHLADDALRQQVFHALRDLSVASYMATPLTWGQMGYPGPTDL